jgi:hypothetical protein
MNNSPCRGADLIGRVRLAVNTSSATSEEGNLMLLTSVNCNDGQQGSAPGNTEEDYATKTKDRICLVCSIQIFTGYVKSIDIELSGGTPCNQTNFYP